MPTPSTPAGLADQAHGDARGERHQLVASAALHLVHLLQGALDARIRLTPEERADTLARGLACGFVAAIQEAGPEHAALRLRALATWVARAADRIESQSPSQGAPSSPDPIIVSTSADVPGALAELRDRRAA